MALDPNRVWPTCASETPVLGVRLMTALQVLQVLPASQTLELTSSPARSLSDPPPRTRHPWRLSLRGKFASRNCDVCEKSEVSEREAVRRNNIRNRLLT